MAIPSTGSILHYLRQTILRCDGAGLTDGQLLRSYLHRHDEAAFEALVRRHGPMVRGVCLRVLCNDADADDAFQAVFLVLLRKADSLATREVLGDWLHGVAYRTALKARAAAARRHLKERRTARSEAVVDDEPRPDWLPLLDREIERLPQKYRLPVLLCDVQGRTRKEAAQQLDWPEGTVSGRLSRARALLTRRLTRCGVTLSAATAAMALTEEASAHLPFALIGSTCKAASGFAAGCAAGSVSAPVAALTEGVVKAMLMSKVKNVVALLTVALVLGVGAGGWRFAIAEQGEKSSPQPTPGEPSAKPIPNPTAAAVPSKSDTLTPIIPPVVAYPSPARYFQIDLKIMERKDGQRKVLAEPRLLTLEGRKASFTSGEPKTIQLGGGTTEEVVVGPAISAVVRSGKEHKVHLDVMVSQPARTIIGEAVLLETKSVRGILEIELGATTKLQLAMGDKPLAVLEVSATVREVKRSLEENTIEAAEERLRMAERYRASNVPEAASYYYKVIASLYPNTIYAERAKERMAELKKQLEKRGAKPANSEEKPPARVGQLFIIGNKKIADKDILKHVKLFPGQILTLPDLRIAERNLSKLKGLKSKPTVTILDSEDKGAFKDICITVEEK